MRARLPAGVYCLLIALLLPGLGSSVPAQPVDLEALRPGWLGFGFHYQMEGGNGERHGWLYVRGVAPESPAEQAGLRAQDLIVALDGKPFLQTRYSQVLGLFAGIEPGQSRLFTVQRGTATLEIPITAAPTTPEQLERWRANYLLARELEDRSEGCCPDGSD